MCDVGDTRVLPSAGTTAALLAKLRRPSCDEQKPADKTNGVATANIGLRAEGNELSCPSRSTPNTPTSLRRDSSLEKCFSDPEFFRKQRQRQQKQRLGTHTTTTGTDHRPTSSSRETELACSEPAITTTTTTTSHENGNHSECSGNKLDAEAPPADLGSDKDEVITNGATRGCRESDECDGPTNGKDIMAPVLGIPPPPPPAPHMGADGLILPRKPYNPCVTSTSHKELHRELLFNQKIGKNVLNQKSELQRALERHREMASRKEAERVQEESCKNDPRTALQRAIEQRAKHIQQSQQPQQTEPPNPLVTARAKLRSRTESQ